MSTREARLAAAIRQSQWLADDVAHDLPYRKVTAAQLSELAEGLAPRTAGRDMPARND